ncbi:MAG: triose-phosphate isomerase [Deltaproteobacteria bacterium]|nr:triose-phosphate isomerase [Deltaproteobacteria bacterium]
MAGNLKNGRIPVIAANWKMNKTLAEAIDFMRGLNREAGKFRGIEIVVCPPFPVLHPAVKANGEDSRVSVAAQNLHHEDKGAFTGEVSGACLKSVGCSYAIVGHSERRQYFNETDDLVNAKAKAAARNGLKTIMCVGETLVERERGMTFDIIERQVRTGLSGLGAETVSTMVIAYEPVWAIGTGRASSPQMAEECHRFIRGLMEDMLGAAVSEKVRIQYGGSVSPENIADFIAMNDIDGALVGGASLALESFLEILKRTSKILN